MSAKAFLSDDEMTALESKSAPAKFLTDDEMAKAEAAPAFISDEEMDSLPDRPGVLGTLTDVASQAASGVVAGGETALRAARTAVPSQKFDEFVAPGIDYLKETQKSGFLQPSKQSKQGEFRRSIAEGAKSATQSITTMVPGAIAGQAAIPVPVVGAAIGGATSGGTLFGLAQYDQLREDYQKRTGVDIETIPEAWKAAVKSSLSEAGTEAASDLLSNLIMGKAGATALGAVGTGVKNMVKQGAKAYAVNTAKALPFEVGSEMANAAYQDTLKPQMGQERQGSWEAAKEVVGPAVVTTALMGAGQQAAGTALGYKEAAASRYAAILEAEKMAIPNPSSLTQPQLLAAIAEKKAQGQNANNTSQQVAEAQRKGITLEEAQTNDGAATPAPTMPLANEATEGAATPVLQGQGERLGTILAAAENVKMTERDKAVKIAEELGIENPRGMLQEPLITAIRKAREVVARGQEEVQIGQEGAADTTANQPTPAPAATTVAASEPVKTVKQYADGRVETTTVETPEAAAPAAPTGKPQAGRGAPTGPSQSAPAPQQPAEDTSFDFGANVEDAGEADRLEREQFYAEMKKEKAVSGVKSLIGEIKRNGGIKIDQDTRRSHRPGALKDLRPPPGVFVHKESSSNSDAMADTLGYESPEAMMDALREELETGKPQYYGGDKYERASYASDSRARNAQRNPYAKDIETATRMAQQQRNNGDSFDVALDRFTRAFGEDAPEQVRKAWENELAGGPLQVGQQRGSVGQRRAAPGGEYGANNEWYEGGKWIANTEASKKKGKGFKPTGRREIEPGKWEAGPDGHLPLYPMMAGFEDYDRATGKFSLNKRLIGEYATQEALASRRETIDAYNSGARWKPRPQSDERASVSPESQAPAPSLPISSVQQQFPGAEVVETAPNAYTVTTEGGLKIDISTAAPGSLTLDPVRGAKSKAEHGAAAEGQVVGLVSFGDGKATIQLTDTGELSHENLHTAIEYVATPAEMLKLREEFKDNWEDAAQDFNAWMNGRQSAHATLWEKIKDLLYRVGQALGVQSKQGIYREIESGRVYKRQPGGERAIRDSMSAAPSPQRASMSVTPEQDAAKVQNPVHESEDGAWVKNLDTFPEEIQSMIRQIALTESFPGEKESWRKRPHAEVLAAAQSLLTNAPEMQKILDSATTSAVKDDMLTALGIMYANSVTNLQTKHDALAANPTDDNKAAYLLAHVSNNALDARLFGARAEAGRALASIGRMKAAIREAGGTPAVQQAMQDRGIGLTEEELAQLISIPAGDPKALLEFQKNVIQAREKHTWNDYITAYRMFNMLFNTSTQSANVVSNFLKTALDVIPDTLEATFSKDKKLADVWTYYKALIKAIPAATQSAGGTLASGVSDLEMKYGLYSGVAGEKAASEFKGGAFNPINMGMRVTRAGDVLFSDAHYLAATEMLATRAGKDKGLEGAELDAYVDAAKLSGKYHKKALLAAKEKTFQEDSDTLRKVSTAINAVPGLRWILPFVKTPYNINAAAMRMIPGVGIGASMLQGKTMTRALAEQSIGIGFTLMGVAMAAAGNATGAPPEGEGEKDKFFNAEKKEAYAVKIGGQWVKYSRLGPLAMPLLAGVAWNEYRQRGGEDKSAVSAISKMMGKVGKMVSDQSMLMGLNGLQKAIADPERYGTQFLKNLGGQMIPAASAQRQFTRGTEDEILEPAPGVEQLLADLPKAERNAILNLMGRTPIPQRVDSLGRPQEYRGGGWQALTAWVKPAESVDDPVVQELLDLNIPYPSAVGKTISEEITSEQRAAKEERLGRGLLKSELKQSGEVVRDDLSEKRSTVGGAVYDATKKVIESPSYQKLDNTKKAELLTSVISKAKSRTVKRANSAISVTRAKTGKTMTLTEEAMRLLKEYRTKKEPKP